MSEKVKALLDGLVIKGTTPGISYCHFSRDQIISSIQCGYADVNRKLPITAFHTLNVYSVTKTFTAIAILHLAEQRKLKLEESAKKFLPSFPYGDKISIHQLLAHTSGISNPIPLRWIHLSEEHLHFDRDKYFQQIFFQHPKLKSVPGKRFSYSNLNYILLGQIIEAVSGSKYEDFVQENILRLIDPGGTELGFSIDESRQAKGYHKRVSIMNAMLGFLIDKPKYMEKTEEGWVPFKFILVNGTAYGGLVGTIGGLVKYAQELLSDQCRFMSPESKRLMFTENKTSAGESTGMCLSWFRGELKGAEYFCHAGGGGGYYCEVRIYPSLGLGSVVMLNRSGMRDERLLSKIDRLILQ